MTNPAFASDWLNTQKEQELAIYLMLDGYTASDTITTLLSRTTLPPFIRIYSDTPLQALAQEGPVLVSLNGMDDPLLPTLMAEPEKRWGCFISCMPDYDLRDLASHWRARSQVVINGMQGAFRFYDNRVLAKVMQRLALEDIPSFLGPISSVLYWHEGHWLQADNPLPARAAVPADPAWLREDTHDAQTQNTLLENVRQYLIAEHYEAFEALAVQREPYAWLQGVLGQARAWQWHQPEQRYVLVMQALYSTTQRWPESWEPLAGESPEKHYERVRRLYSQYAQSVGDAQ